MTKKYIASLMPSLRPKLAQVTVSFSTPKLIVTSNPVSLIGDYKPASRLYLAQYHVFDSLEEAKEYLVKTAEKKVERLKSDLASIG